jgi:hypothetical protein
MPSPLADQIVIDTLGKLHAHGYGVGGYCLDCRRLFAVSMMVLMLERGRDYSPIRMAPLRCPGCGGRYRRGRVDSRGPDHAPRRRQRKALPPAYPMRRGVPCW